MGIKEIGSLWIFFYCNVPNISKIYEGITVLYAVHLFPKQNTLTLKLNRNVHIPEFYAYVSCIHSVVVEMNDKTPVKIEPF